MESDESGNAVGGILNGRLSGQVRLSGVVGIRAVWGCVLHGKDEYDECGECRPDDICRAVAGWNGL